MVAFLYSCSADALKEAMEILCCKMELFYLDFLSYTAQFQKLRFWAPRETWRMKTTHSLQKKLFFLKKKTNLF